MTYPEVALMKLFALAALGALALFAQDEPKHLAVPASPDRPMTVKADQIERGAPYPSTIHLKGNVEIRTGVCVRTQPGNSLSCDGYTVLRAEEADVQEDTGAVEARGNVRLTHEK